MRRGLAGKIAGFPLFYLFVWLLKIENLIFGFHEISATLAYNYNNVDSNGSFDSFCFPCNKKIVNCSY